MGETFREDPFMRTRFLIPIAVLAAAAGLTLGEVQHVEERGAGARALPGKLLPVPEPVRDLSPACMVFPATPAPRRGSRRPRPPRPVVPAPLCVDPGAVTITV